MGRAAGEQWSYAQLETVLRRIETRTAVNRAAAKPTYVHHRMAARPYRNAAIKSRSPIKLSPRASAKHASHSARREDGAPRMRYLAARAQRPEPHLLTEATATKVLFDGHRAAGVEFDRGGRTASGAGTARGGAVRRRDQQPAAADALRNRRSRPARRARHRRGQPRRRVSEPICSIIWWCRWDSTYRTTPSSPRRSRWSC